MERAEINLSVVQPVVTDPHQYDSIIRFASQLNEARPHLVSFAGLHPDQPNYKELLRQIAAEGFKGIKLHPNYQGVFFDDIRYLRIVYAASELGLAVLVHAGEDPYTPGQFYCSPDMALHVLAETAPPKLILAHMGCNGGYDEAEAKLCGQNVYLDTAYSLMHMPEKQLVRMIHLHGADKVLFGSDSPWTDQKADVEKIRSLTGLSESEKELILHQNAEILLQ